MSNPRALIALMCGSEVLIMLGVFALPALLPTFIDTWQLTGTEAGWIAGIYFAGYAAAAPVLLALTDRIDAKRIYIGGAIVAALSAAGFGLLADGFWSALGLRFAAGIGLAATYMPGLRILIDRYRGPKPSRAIALYTSHFSLGTALSFFFAGEIATTLGWPAVFLLAAIAALAVVVLAALLPPVTPPPQEVPVRLLDFRPVFANRTVMGYVLAYGAHCWELFTLRSWMVAFLAFSVALQGNEHGWWPSPTDVATLSGLVAMAASIGGNELAQRFGRRRTITGVMILSAVGAAIIGFTAPLPYGFVAVLALAYTGAVQLDSGALTAGAVATAIPSRRGATIAVHSLVGFGGAAIGPLVLGVVLDLAGGATSVLAWGLGFASVAWVGVVGPLALRRVQESSV